MMKKDAKIFVAGCKGLVGSAITRKLKQQGYTNLLLPDRSTLDLTNQQAVNNYFHTEQPEYVFIAAAKVGGIYANSTYRGEFIYNNLVIQVNLIEAARQYNVKRLMFLGSSCIYPRNCPQPMKEEHLLTGLLEPTNEAYAIAKIAGIKMCDAYNVQYGTNFVSVMPTNLYGPNDNFDLNNAHVLPALLRKFHEATISNAPSVTVWGSGNPSRDFLHVDDAAEAFLFIMEKENHTEMLNVGSGRDVTIREVATILADTTGFKGQLIFDTSKPDGTPLKALDTSKLNRLGWQPKYTLEAGIKQTYQWFLEHYNSKIERPCTA